MKRISTGIENFKELLDNNYYYVDKTRLIEDVLSDKVMLYTRPRRFGKTLNLSMLYYFFSNKEKENSYLFEGLNISKDKEILKHQNQYPIIFLTLKDMNNNNFQSQIYIFTSLIANIIDIYAEIKNSDTISQRERKLLDTVNTPPDTDSPMIRFADSPDPSFLFQVIETPDSEAFNCLLVPA